MKITAIYTAVCAALLSAAGLSAENTAAIPSEESQISPDGTYLYAKRDTCDLYLDVYSPAEESEKAFEGKEKPAIIFVFGGGFSHGSKDNPAYLPWFRTMTDNGYRIIAIDYRLGLKDSAPAGKTQAAALDKAIHLAMEDLFCATQFIMENSEMLEIDPANLVLCGTSAGAITALQAEYEICNSSQSASILPENFNYAGVMAFAGGILLKKGKLKFETEPAPILMVHGTNDQLVHYSHIRFLNYGFFGSDKITDRLKKFGYTYNMLRYVDSGHEIAEMMDETAEEQFRFIETNIMKGSRCITDMLIGDPS